MTHNVRHPHCGALFAMPCLVCMIKEVSGYLLGTIVLNAQNYTFANIVLIDRQFRLPVSTFTTFAEHRESEE